MDILKSLGLSYVSLLSLLVLCHYVDVALARLSTLWSSDDSRRIWSAWYAKFETQYSLAAP